MQKTTINYPIPAVIAVVIQNDEILLVRRGQEPNKGRWGFPGGKIEIGESITEAALRELKEETGITAKAEHILTAFDVCLRNAQDQVQFHYVLIPVLCSYLSGEPIAASDAAEARWLLINELDEADPNLIEQVLNITQEAQRFI